MVPGVLLHDFHDPVCEVGGRGNISQVDLEADPHSQVLVWLDRTELPWRNR
jgi:hypothetical protein